MRILRAFILVLLLSGFSQASAQKYKFLATGVSIKVKTNSGSWSDWSDVKPENMTILFDTDKNRFVVYSQAIQIYKIMEYKPEEESDSDLVYNFPCTDENGVPVSVSIITRKKQNNRKQLYIKQRDLIIVYNIINFPEPETEPKK